MPTNCFNPTKKRLPILEESYPTEIDGYKYFSTIGISSEHRKYFRIYKKPKKLILDVNKLAKGKNIILFQVSSPQEIIVLSLMEKMLMAEENIPL